MVLGAGLSTAGVAHATLTPTVGNPCSTRAVGTSRWLLSKFAGEGVAERAVTATRVVLALDVGEQRQPCLGLRLERASVDQLALEAGEETLGHGIIKRITYCSHGRPNSHLAAAVAEGQAGVLTSLVT